MIAIEHTAAGNDPLRTGSWVTSPRTRLIALRRDANASSAADRSTPTEPTVVRRPLIGALPQATSRSRPVGERGSRSHW